MTDYDIIHEVKEGIERIHYIPHRPNGAPPIVMQHGMWHGAWCWSHWQARLADLGWESHAHSLPAHGQSPAQRPLRWCTLNYYLTFLRAEIERMPRKPILMGHSMGGALTQWYLKDVADDLPAAVLVAAWNSHEMQSSVLNAMWRDPIGGLLCFANLMASPMVRSPWAVSQLLISQNAVISPESLAEQVGGESWWVLLQYNPLLWQPKKTPTTPLLWIIPEEDHAVLASTQTRSARFYNADVIRAPQAGHNVMIERDHQALADQIDVWLQTHIP